MIFIKNTFFEQIKKKKKIQPLVVKKMVCLSSIHRFVWDKLAFQNNLMEIKYLKNLTGCKNNINIQ